MTALGVSRLVVSKILNHTERGVTQVYDRHGYDLEKRQALEAWADRLRTIVNRLPSHCRIVAIDGETDTAAALSAT